MLRYAVVEIAGKQYKVSPDEKILVDFLGDVKNFECDKVLVWADDKKLTVGSPYLKEKLKFEILGTEKEKIRVSKYKPKANYRKVKGSKKVMTQIKLQFDSEKSKKTS